MKRHSKCHDCPYRERKGVCKACRAEAEDKDGETIRRKFAKLRAKRRSHTDE